MTAEAVVKLGVPERIPILFPVGGERLIDSCVVRPISFQNFIECVNEAQNMTQPKTFEARLKRCRLMRQVTFYSGNATAQVSVEELLRMPISVARVVLPKLDAEDIPAGK